MKEVHNMLYKHLIWTWTRNLKFIFLRQHDPIYIQCKLIFQLTAVTWVGVAAVHLRTTVRPHPAGRTQTRGVRVAPLTVLGR